MEQNEIDQNNILLCEFMGMKYNGLESIHFPIGTWTKDGVGHCAEKGILFKVSWDWLMPVFEKYCEEVEKIMPNSSRTRISFCVDFIAGVWANDIDTSYKYLVSGIRWYNDKIKSQ